MRSNSSLYFGTLIFFFVITCLLLIPGIYGAIYHESMLVNNHGKLVVPSIGDFIPLLWTGSMVGLFLILMLLKYRRVELEENGIRVFGILKNKVLIPWNEVQYLRRANWRLPEKIIYKVKANGMSSFYFRTDYQYLIWTKWRKKIDTTEMEKFIAVKKVNTISKASHTVGNSAE